MGIYEIFMVTDNIQNLIFNNATTTEIKDGARKDGMRTLRDDGLRKAMTGSTTLEEVIRITATDEE
jgi:type IV pilus assembly protein PilB